MTKICLLRYYHNLSNYSHSYFQALSRSYAMRSVDHMATIQYWQLTTTLFPIKTKGCISKTKLHVKIFKKRCEKLMLSFVSF